MQKLWDSEIYIFQDMDVISYLQNQFFYPTWPTMNNQQSYQNPLSSVWIHYIWQKKPPFKLVDVEKDGCNLMFTVMIDNKWLGYDRCVSISIESLHQRDRILVRTFISTDLFWKVSLINYEIVRIFLRWDSIMKGISKSRGIVRLYRTTKRCFRRIEAIR
jgi:hypothetical protein